MTAGRVDIVGGGIAGLLAAVELARAGAQVSLFEAAGDPGGRARTRTMQGFFFNQGPHALYVGGAFRRELDRLGIAHSGTEAKPAQRKGILRGKLHDLPFSATSLLTTRLFSVGDKLAYGRVLKEIMEGATGAGSFADWLNGQKLSPVLRQSIEAMGRLTSYGNGSERVSAAMMLDQIRLGLGGALYVDGGWSTLVAGLAEAARASGAELRTGASAARVEVGPGGARLVLADGEERLADAILLAVGPKEAAKLAPDVSSLAAEADEAIPVRANTLDLALSAWPKGAGEFALGIDQPYYLSLHSSAARLAPEGGALVHVAKYLPEGAGPSQTDVAELEAVADLVMPGWRGVEVKRQVLRAMTVSNALPRWDRARPAVRVADAPGLFIAGDWVGEEGMIADAAAASAIAAARAALRWAAAKGADRPAA